MTATQSVSQSVELRWIDKETDDDDDVGGNNNNINSINYTIWEHWSRECDAVERKKKEQNTRTKKKKRKKKKKDWRAKKWAKKWTMSDVVQCSRQAHQHHCGWWSHLYHIRARLVNRVHNSKQHHTHFLAHSHSHSAPRQNNINFSAVPSLALLAAAPKHKIIAKWIRCAKWFLWCVVTPFVCRCHCPSGHNKFARAKFRHTFGFVFAAILVWLFSYIFFFAVAFTAYCLVSCGPISTKQNNKNERKTDSIFRSR